MYMYLRLFVALPSSEEDAILSIGKLVYGPGIHTMPHDRRTHIIFSLQLKTAPVAGTIVQW